MVGAVDIMGAIGVGIVVPGMALTVAGGGRLETLPLGARVCCRWARGRIRSLPGALRPKENFHGLVFIPWKSRQETPCLVCETLKNKKRRWKEEESEDEGGPDAYRRKEDWWSSWQDWSSGSGSAGSSSSGRWTWARVS
eukprot:s225_g22.t1